MVEGSVVWIAATLVENTVIIASALCRGVSVVNTNCLSTVEFGDLHADAEHIRRDARLVPLESVAHGFGHGRIEPSWDSF